MTGGHASDRFSGRVDAYAAARPDYPGAVLDWARRWADLAVVADVGAGTGIFTRLLVDHGAHVHAVEPNGQMRAVLGVAFGGDAQVEIHPGSAEATGLADTSVSLVSAAQAAHWFTPAAAVEEWRRILRAPGHVLLVWNDWREAPSPVNDAYREVVRRHAIVDEGDFRIRVPTERMAELLPDGMAAATWHNPVRFSRARLQALARSASYLPSEGDPRLADLERALDALFDAHANGEALELTYLTRAFIGPLAPTSRDQPPKSVA